MAFSDPSKILVVGFGYVGRPLAEELVNQGYQVHVLCRSEVVVADHSGIRMNRGDAADPNALSALPIDIGQIISVASPDERSEQAYQRAYPNVVANLLRAFPRARVILVSSTAVYDQGDGTLVDEHSPANAKGPTTTQLKLAERLLLGEKRQGPLRNAPYLHHVVVRASGIYGPGRTRLIHALAGSALTADEAQLWTSRVHRDDLVGILAFLIKKQNVSGVINATDPRPATLGEIKKWALDHLDAPPAGQASDGLRSRKNRRILPTRLLALGYPFRFRSFAEGYAMVLGPIPS